MEKENFFWEIIWFASKNNQKKIWKIFLKKNSEKIYEKKKFDLTWKKKIHTFPRNSSCEALKMKNLVRYVKQLSQVVGFRMFVLCISLLDSKPLHKWNVIENSSPQPFGGMKGWKAPQNMISQKKKIWHFSRKSFVWSCQDKEFIEEQTKKKLEMLEFFTCLCFAFSF